jgi:hypothetical protein
LGLAQETLEEELDGNIYRGKSLYVRLMCILRLQRITRYIEMYKHLQRQMTLLPVYLVGREPQHARSFEIGVQAETLSFHETTSTAGATRPRLLDRLLDPFIVALRIVLIVECVDEKAAEELGSVEGENLSDAMRGGC